MNHFPFFHALAATLSAAAFRLRPLLAFTAGAGAMLTAHGQTAIAIPGGTRALLAGWDFGNITSTTSGAFNARYSDVWGDVTTNPFSLNAGTIYFNGTGGSDNWPSVTRVTSGADIDRPILGRLATAGLGTLSGPDGMLSLTSFAANTKDEFSIKVHSLDAVNTFENLSLSLFGKDSGATAGGVTINWSYSIDGGVTKVATDLTSSFSGGGFTNSLLNFSALSALDGLNDVYLIGKVSESAGTANLQIDNLALYGFSKTASGGAVGTFWMGGSGAWTAAATPTNWRDSAGANPSAWSSTEATFRGTAGTVTVESTVAPVVFTGLKFEITGFTVAGGNLTTNTASAPIQVGTNTAATVSMNATISAPIIGTGGVDKTGLGTLTLSGNNTYTGNTTVTAGTLVVNGNQSGATGAVSVASLAKLSGTGTVSNVAVQNGGTLSGQTGSLFTMSGLSLNATSQLNVTLGALSTTGLFKINGSLVLDGVLNVTSATGFGPGLYRLLDYTGALTNQTLQTGNLPAGVTSEIQTSVANQVNVVFATSGGPGPGGPGPGGPGGGPTGARPMWIGGAGNWSADPASTSWKSVDGTQSGKWEPGMAIFQGTPGTVTVDTAAGAVAVTGVQFAVDGYTVAGGSLVLSTARTTLRVGDGTSAGSSMRGTISAPLTGSGGLDKTDLGTLVLTGANTYAGGTTINSGTLQIGAGETSGSITGHVANNGALIFNRSDAVTFAGAITGTGAVTHAGSGTTSLTGANTYTGGTTISAGILQIGAGGTSGSLAGNVTNNANLSFNRSDSVTFSGTITGPGSVTQAGSGTTSLASANDYAGGTTISAGTLQIGVGGTTGSISGNVTNNGTLGFNRSDAIVFDGIIGSGSGGVEQRGRGTTTLTGDNTYTGTTRVNAGTLLVNGNQTAATGAVTVASGGTLGGTGTTGAVVTVENGGAISAPSSGAFTVGGLTLSGSAAQANFALGAPSTTRPLQVNGALILDGLYNLSSTGGLAPGAYRLIDYTGALIDNTIQFGTAPVNPGDLTLQTATANQVNLLFAATVSDYWKGATGTWSGVGGTDWQNFSDAAAGAWQSRTATFRGTAGTVTVENTAGAVTFTGAQFITSGYTLAGGTLTTNVDNTRLQVGDGSAAGATTTATISATIAGTGGINKTDLGTLTLSGNNTYAGTTTVSAGTLLINGNQTTASGAVTVSAGARLGGTGSAANISIQDGGTLLGQSGSTFTMTGLALSPNSHVSVSLGAPSTTGLFQVNGALTLDGSLDIINAGAYGPGLYRLFNYTGGLTDNGLLIGSKATSALIPTLQTTVANQVNLLVAVAPLPIWTGGSGTWSAASTGTSWGAVDGTYQGGWQPGMAIFQGAPGIVSVNTTAGAVVVTGVQFAADGYEINGGELTTNTARTTLRVGDGTAAGSVMTGTIASPVTGTGGIEKSDLGTLILSGANTYTGGTTVSAGLLQIGAGGTSGSITGNVTNNAALSFNRSDALTYSGVIGGTGAVTHAGTGTTTLTGVNTYTGGTTIAAGTVQLGAGGTTGSITGNVTNNAALRFNRSDAVTYSDVISGTGAVTQAGSGTTTLTGVNTYTGGTTITAGTLQLGAGGTTGGIAGSVTNNAVLSFNRSDAVTYSGVVSGTGAVTHAGAGTTMLTSANTYTGGTTIAAGTLQLGAGGTSGSITGNVVNQATLAVNRSDATTLSGVISGSGELRQLGDGATSLTGANTYSGGTTITAGTLQIGAGGTSGNIAGNIANNSKLAINRRDAVTLDGVISGTGALTQAGTGTTMLTGANTYAGGTTINSGTLQIGSGGTSGGITGNVTNNGTLALNRSDAVTMDGLVSGTGTLRQHGSGTSTLTGANTYTGGTIVNSGTLQIGSGGTSGSLTGNVVNSATLSINRSDAVTLAGVVSGTGTLVQQGAGTTILTAANTYTGATAINAGTLQIGSGGTSGSVAGNIINHGTLAINRSEALALNNVISGTGTLVQLGAGTTALSGNNTYSGGTTISSGVLEIADNSNLGASSGGVTLNGGTLRTAAGLSMARSLNVSSSGGTIDTGANILVMQGAIGGSGNLTKTGTGQLTLSGANSFTGTTNLSQGAIMLNANTLGATNIAANARLAGNGTIRGNLSNAGLLSPGASAGTVTVTGNYTQAATGTYAVELASATSFDSLVVNGTANLGGSLAVSGLGGFVPQAGQTFRIIEATNGVTGTFASVISPWSRVSPMLRFEALYHAKDVLLSMTQLPFAGVTGTPNQISIGQGLDGAIALGAVPHLQRALNALPNTDRVRAALSELSPQRYERWFQQSVYNAGATIHSAESRMEQATREARGSLWSDIVGRQTTFKGNDESLPASGTSSGITVGADSRVHPDLQLGLLFGYTGENLQLDEAGSSTDVRRFTASVYGRYDLAPLFIESVLGATHANLDSRRTVAIPGYERLAELSNKSQDRYGSLRAGYIVAVGRTKLTPYAGVNYVRWSADAARESGANDANLHLAGQSSDSLASRLGATMAFPHLDESISFTPKIDLSWRHEFRNTRPHLTADLGGSSFTLASTRSVALLPGSLETGTTSATEKTDGIIAGVTVDVTFGSWMTAYLRVSAEWSTAASKALEARAGTEFRF